MLESWPYGVIAIDIEVQLRIKNNIYQSSDKF